MKASLIIIFIFQKIIRVFSHILSTHMIEKADEVILAICWCIKEVVVLTHNSLSDRANFHLLVCLNMHKAPISSLLLLNKHIKPLRNKREVGL